MVKLVITSVRGCLSRAGGRECGWLVLAKKGVLVAVVLPEVGVPRMIAASRNLFIAGEPKYSGKPNTPWYARKVSVTGQLSAVQTSRGSPNPADQQSHRPRLHDHPLTRDLTATDARRRVARSGFRSRPAT
jgi:hypothetical protein